VTKRRNLTPQELDQIAFLTEERKLSPRQIALRIGCSVGSVTWAQLRIGADKHPDKPLPPVPVVRPVAMRSGRPVVGFNHSDDSLLETLAKEGLSDAEIGRRMQPARRPNSVRGRLMTLARRASRAEAQAAPHG
jgi:hypothetical protein